MIKTVVSTNGYRHNHRSKGQNVATFHGLECPSCHRTVPLQEFDDPLAPLHRQQVGGG